MEVVSYKRDIPGPDRGWAWVVALACFFNNFIMAGLARSAGVLYVALIETFGASRESASTPFTIRFCVRNMSGPLIGLLGERFGIRAVTIAGGIVGAAGGILCYIAPDVLWITVFWGVVQGLGYGLSNTVHMLMINQYFEKYRATALGLGYCGDCVGTFVLPVVIELLLHSYGVKGAFLVIGGLCLNIVPLAMLLRPPPWLNRKRHKGELDHSNVVQNHARCTSLKSSGEFENAAYINNAYISTEVPQIKVCLDLARKHDDSLQDEKPCKVTKDLPIPSYEEAIRDTPPYSKDQNDKLGPSRCENESKNNITHTNSTSNISNDTESNCIKNSSLRCSDRNIPSGNNIASTDENTLSAVYHNTSSDALRSSPLQSLQCPTHIHETETETTLPTNDDIQDKDSNTVNNICLEIANDVSATGKPNSIATVVLENIDVDHNSLVTTTITDCDVNGQRIIRIRTLSKSIRDDQDGVNLNSPRTMDEEDKLVKSEKSYQDVVVSSNVLTLIHNQSEASLDPPHVSSEAQRHGVCQINYGVTKLHDSLEIPTEYDSKRHLDNPAAHGVLRHAVRANLKPMFLLISFTMAAYVLLFIAVITVIIDFAVDKGISQEQGKYLIISFSAADVMGRLGFGVVIDRHWIAMKHYAAGCVGSMGALVTLLPFCSNFVLMTSCMSLYGLVQGGVAIMYPILINIYMNKDEESIGMGSINFYGGVLMLALAPMIGFFRDNYESYDGMFYIVGLLTLLMGLLWLLEPCIVKCQNRQNGNNVLRNDTHHGE